MNDVQKEVRKLSRLVQFKNKDKSTLEHIAQISVWKRQLKITDRFENTSEKTLSKEMLDNYLDNYTFTCFNDIQNIGDLIFEEMAKLRFQKEIDKLLSEKKATLVNKLMPMLHDIESRIWELKEKVGIVGKKEVSDLTALQELQKKFKIYQNFNRNEFTFWAPVKCKDCQSTNVQPVLIRRRCNKEKFDILVHPAFSGRFLYNKEIFKDIREGKLTKEQGARYQRTSVKYIDWVLLNEHKIIEIDGVEKEEIDEFVDNNPNLKKASDYKE